MGDEYIVRVSQLNEYVSGLLRRESLLQYIGVRGEISGFKRHSSGHLYFSLKDEAALIRCVMFRAKAMNLRCELRDGMQVVVYGSVSLFVRDGQYQLYAENIKPEGEGELYRQFLLMKGKLAAEGLFDAAHKKALPMLPKCIGVVTSPTGAVIHDIENVAGRRFPQMPILLYPVPVQGPGAAEKIADGIREMNRMKRADVLIVGRGGGSIEDLWPFNEEVVARAIYESKIPVISAVGHESDESIADYAADYRAPTPSAAAELCVPEYAALTSFLKERQEKLLYSSKKRIEQERDRIAGYENSAALAEPKHRLRVLRADLDRQAEMLGMEIRTMLMSCSHKLDELSGRCEALSPRRVMESGYTMIRRDGHYLGSSKALSSGDSVEIVFNDGMASANISAVQERNE